MAMYDDFGASLHVLGAADGLEYLRFDCFEVNLTTTTSDSPKAPA